MAGKTRSSGTKAATTPKVGSAFTSTKRISTSGVKGKPATIKSATSAKSKASTPRDKSQDLNGLYQRLYRDALKRMGEPIHRGEKNSDDRIDDIEIILRQFDQQSEFGPCSRISRLERFERAEKLGLNPDPEIGDILRSEEGRTQKKYSDSIFQI